MGGLDYGRQGPCMRDVDTVLWSYIQIEAFARHPRMHGMMASKMADLG